MLVATCLMFGAPAPRSPSFRWAMPGTLSLPLCSYPPPVFLQLADFGLATVLSLPTYKVVEPVGSPGYAAPEVLRVLPYDGQADMFSLGVVSFLLLSGACVCTVLYCACSARFSPPSAFRSVSAPECACSRARSCLCWHMQHKGDRLLVPQSLLSVASGPKGSTSRVLVFTTHR